ncbi:MAG: hypothetical protein R3F24_06675 [Gammaproteobacteria bacterium]
MPDRIAADEDQRLEILFRPAAAPVVDEGFSVAVMKRVARHTWRRRLVLATAGLAGLFVAARPAWEIVLVLGRELAQLGGRAPDLALILVSPLTILAGLLLMTGLSLLQWLDE